MSTTQEKKTVKSKGFPRIEFNPDTTPQAEESRMNKYGLDLTNPDFMKYQHEGLEAEVIGGVNTLNLTRFSVMLKISRRPQTSAQDVYRNNVDLYSENNVTHFVKQTSVKLKVDSTTIADFVYDLIQRLEDYRKDRLTYKEETFVVDGPPPKEYKSIKKILESDDLVNELKGLMTTAGMICDKASIQLFIVSLSSKLQSPMHCILQGNTELTSELIQGFSSVLPVEVNRFKTSISDNVLYYAPNKNYWTNKVLLLPTIDKLGQKNLALTELITQGQVNRMVTENTEQGSYRAKTRIVNGQLSFISSTSKGFHELLNNDNVIALPLKNEKQIKDAMASNVIKKHAGLIDSTKVDNAKKLLKFIFRELKPVQIVNSYLDELDIMKFFDGDCKQIAQFLRITNLITLLHQKQLGVTKVGNMIQVEVQPKHILLTLELFQELWVKEEAELNFQVAGTFSRLKEVLKQQEPKGYKEVEFTVKGIREKLKMFPATLARHINTLFDYGKIERTGGNRREGYTYSVTNWNNANTSAERFNEFKKMINSL